MIFGTTLRVGYQIDIKDKLSDPILEDDLAVITNELFEEIFYYYRDNYKNSSNNLSVAANLSSLKTFLKAEILEAENNFKSFLNYIISKWELHPKKNIDEYLKKYFKSQVELWEVHHMSPNQILMFDHLIDKGIEISQETLDKSEFIDFILLSLTYNRFLVRIPERLFCLGDLSLLEIKFLLDQRDIINLRLNNDIITHILRYYFENHSLPIIHNQLIERDKSVHGNTKIEFDDETIKEKALLLIGQGKFIHQGKNNKGLANLNGLAESLLKTVFKNIGGSISPRQLVRRLKKVLPQEYLP